MNELALGVKRTFQHIDVRYSICKWNQTIRYM